MSENIDLKTGSCFFGHKWTKWELTEQKICKVIEGVAYEGVKTLQIRRCTKCGKTQTIKVE